MRYDRLVNELRAAANDQANIDRGVHYFLVDAADAINRLQRDCAEFYQCFGSATDPEVQYDEHDVMRVMDNMSDAACGDPRRHDDLLPWPRG